MTDQSMDKLARRLAEAVPEGLRALGDDLEQKFRTILETAVSRMDLVTREEFDVQQAILERTRTKLGELERRLAEIDRQGEQ